MRKFKLFAVFVLLALVLSAGWGAVLAQQPPPAPFEVTPSTEEPVRGLTKAEYQEEIADFYDRPDWEVVVDLEDPEGIDPDLLPPNLAALVNSDTKVVAYKETRHRDSRTLSDSTSSCDSSLLGISCKQDDNGSYDVTVSRKFGDNNVEQFNRILALRYEDYSGCGQPCTGLEFEKEWAWWTRTNSDWYVDDARMSVHADPADNYCTEESGISFHYYSTFFLPEWNGNTTYYYYINGFPDEAYVTCCGYSQTRGDIWQTEGRGDELVKDNAITRHQWGLNPGGG